VEPRSASSRECLVDARRRARDDGGLGSHRRVATAGRLSSVGVVTVRLFGLGRLVRGMIRSFDGTEPTIADSAYVDPAATVIGDVTLEVEASVWPGVVLRGDHGGIVIREGANVQDNSTLHEGAEIGPYATVGHNAIVHGATVGERAMVGMGAIVLDGSTVGEKSLVGANSLVTEETDIPPSVLAAGTPAEVVDEVDESVWHDAGDRYVELSHEHASTSEIIAEEHRPEGD
jgi:carbonic anhydrase/acetyltransferase-like protein (isoleucine patch superfamily)